MALLCYALFYGVMFVVQVTWTSGALPARVSSSRPPPSTGLSSASIHPTKAHVQGPMKGHSPSLAASGHIPEGTASMTHPGPSHYIAASMTDHSNHEATYTQGGEKGRKEKGGSRGEHASSVIESTSIPGGKEGRTGRRDNRGQHESSVVASTSISGGQEDRKGRRGSRGEHDSSETASASILGGQEDRKGKGGRRGEHDSSVIVTTSIPDGKEDRKGKGGKRGEHDSSVIASTSIPDGKEDRKGKGGKRGEHDSSVIASTSIPDGKEDRKGKGGKRGEHDSSVIASTSIPDGKEDRKGKGSSRGEHDSSVIASTSIPDGKEDRKGKGGKRGEHDSSVIASTSIPDGKEDRKGKEGKRGEHDSSVIASTSIPDGKEDRKGKGGKRGEHDSSVIASTSIPDGKEDRKGKGSSRGEHTSSVIVTTSIPDEKEDRKGKGGRKGEHTSSVIATTSSPGKTYKYKCPKRCVSCDTVKTACMALDKHGNILSTFSVSPEVSAAFAEFKAMATFKIDTQIATCEGFKSFFGTFNVLSTTVKTSLAGFLANTTTTTATEMKLFPKEVYALLKSDVQSYVYNSMTTDQKVVVCDQLDSVDCLTKTVITALLKCANILMSNGVSLTTKEKRQLVDIDAYLTWTTDDWVTVVQQSPELLNKTHFKSMPIDVMVENMESLKLVATSLNTGAVKAIETRLKEWMLATPNVLADITTEWLELMRAIGAKPKTISDVLGVAASLSELDMSKVSKEEGKRFMEEATIEMSTLKSAEIVSLISVLSKANMLLLDPDELQTAAPEIFALGIDESQMKTIVEVIKEKLPRYLDPSSFDDAKIEIIARILKYFSEAEFDLIPKSAVLSSIESGKFESVGKTSRKSGRSVLKMYIENSGSNGALSTNEIKKLGAKFVLNSLDVEGMSKVPAESFTEEMVSDLDVAFEEIDTSMSNAFKDSFIKKVAQGAGLKSILEASSLAKKVSTSLLVEEMSSIDDIAGDNTKLDMVVTIKQARFLKEKMDTLSVTITLQRAINIRPYTCALTEEQIDDLDKDSSYLDILYSFSESPCVTSDRIFFLYKRSTEYLSFDSTPAADLEEKTTTLTLENIPPNILAKYTEEELNKYGSTLCWKIVERLGLADIDLLTRTELQANYQYSIVCLEKTTGTITADDLLLIGNMECGMPVADYGRLDNDALDQYTKWIQRTCPIDNAQRQALADAYVVAMALTTSIKTYEIMILGTLFLLLPQEIIDSVTAETILDVAGTIFDEYLETEKGSESRKLSGNTKDFSEDDKNAYASEKKQFSSIIAKAIQTKADSDNRRRRRSTAALTCSDLQILGTTGMSALDTTQLSSLADVEFTDCVETLGSVTDYSDVQKTALLEVAMRASVWGDPSTWTVTNVYNAGGICQAMTEAQIGTLTLDLDAVSRLGQFSGWDSLKKKAVYERWLSLLKGDDSSTITSSELRSLGHITCGADSSDIDVIPHAVYKSAADSIGELTSCDDTQLHSFATLAKTAYGNDVTTWPSSVISNIGITIGGLPVTDIGLLSSTQIDAIDANHISHIPSATFAGFTVTQFLTFSVSQTASSTTDQRSSLSDAQLAALSLDFSTLSDNGAGMSSGMLLLLLPAITVYQHLK